jgi:hypothetical protein
MIVSLIIFISIDIFCFLLIDILFSKVTNVQGVLQQLNADIATKDDNNMNSVLHEKEPIVTFL